MRPTFGNLAKAKSGKLTVMLDLLKHKSGGEGLGESRAAARLTGSEGSLKLEAGQGDPPGMWVHYLETRAAYGISAGGETWSASGPFSGCQIVIGKKDGRIYVAHLAEQSGSTADQDWAGRGWRDEVWARWKVPVPSQTFYSSSIVFVDWAAGNTPRNISVVRMDIKTKAMGGFDQAPMDIFNVVQLVNPE